ncbi:MAG: Spermidine synthase, partial [Verrucomicrobiaceae bacterium]|nr:Spermidine synthase [Verrucomicrobiaceae bacterium]
AFVLVSTLQAVTVILPAVLGDGFAFGSLVVNYVTRGFGFASLVGGWVVIMMAMAFLPSLIAGIQFPLLVSLLGRGNAGVGRELGRAYLSNTAGAIAGSLLGGFVLIPTLGLLTCWYVVAGLIGLMPVAAMMVLNRNQRLQRAKQPVHQGTLRASYLALAAGMAAVLLSPGPSSVWFHTPIGYGRTTALPNTPEKLEEWKRSIRRSHVESFDGRETSVAVMNNDQYILLTNGKADGSALGDAATQVMLGLTGAALHPNPKRACVIGLGTGTTVGWLADVPGMQHVDAIEIEKHMQDLAKHFTAVNRNAMNHPKVNHVVGDAREFLVTGGEGYDLIVSEPSNPYRAGVASLYTQEFYRSVRERLNEDGILCQWVQGYEALPETIDTVIATLGREFPKVEIWNTMHNDLLLVASVSNRPWDADHLRSRIKEEPFATALRRLWSTDSAEGFFAHCLANEDFTRRLANAAPLVNTDDLNVLEFSYARSIGRDNSNNAFEYRQKAYSKDQMLPKLRGKPLEEEMLGHELLSCLWVSSHVVGSFLPHRGSPPPASVTRMKEAYEAHLNKNNAAFERICSEMPLKTLQERWLVTVHRAVRGDARAQENLKEMEPLFPENVALLRTGYAFARQDYPAARRALINACAELRRSAWVDTGLLQPTLSLAEPLSSSLTQAVSADAQALYHAVRKPFLAGVGDDMRLTALTGVAGHLNDQARLDMIDAWGPHFPWRGLPLAIRTGTYLTTKDPRLSQALAEMQAFLDGGGELPKPAKPAPDKSVKETASAR